MEQVLQDIKNGKYKTKESPKRKKELENKKNWYKIGKVLAKGYSLKLHNSSKLVAKRTYNYYLVNKGEWEGPAPWKFGRMKKKEFNKLLEDRVRAQFNSLDDLNLEEEGLTRSNRVFSSHDGHVSQSGQWD
jgi:hypothetical protein